jgi:hypothetical protein
LRIAKGGEVVAFTLDEYPARAESLLNAGRHLLDSFEDDEIDRNIATIDLETAAASRLPADNRLGFAASTEGSPSAAGFASFDDALGAAMLDLQSANVLLSAGAALTDGSDTARTWLKHSIANVSESQSAITSAFSATKLNFAAPAQPSNTIDDALTLFQTNASKALTAVSDGTVSVIDSVATQLKKLDGAKVLEALNKLGQSFDAGVAAGRLITQGLAKLKSVLDSLSSLFGPEAFTAIKTKVQEIWKKIVNGDYTRAAVRWALSIERVESRVTEIAKSKAITIHSLDMVSRSLALLDDDYQRLLMILNGIVSAIVVAMGVLGFLHLAGPWMALTGAAAYVCVMAAAVLAGIGYTGTMPVGRVRGVLAAIDLATSQGT